MASGLKTGSANSRQGTTLAGVSQEPEKGGESSWTTVVKKNYNEPSRGNGRCNAGGKE